MQSSVTVDIVRSEFNHLGVISRVDFVPKGKTHGFAENIINDFKAAYVHVISLTTRGISIKKYITEHDFGFTFYLQHSETSFWVLLNAKNPIPDTMMNTAQIVDNCRFLERKVEEQQEKLEEQAATIKQLQENVEGVRNVVYQLLGGLYCQNTQTQMIDVQLAALYPDRNDLASRNDDSSQEDSSKWDVWPTTRQGDYCERRIEELEKKLDKICLEKQAVDNEEK